MSLAAVALGRRLPTAIHFSFQGVPESPFLSLRGPARSDQGVSEAFSGGPDVRQGSMDGGVLPTTEWPVCGAWAGRESTAVQVALQRALSMEARTTQVASVPMELHVHPRTRVTLTKNINKDCDYVNGMGGTVLGAHRAGIGIRTDTGYIVMVFLWTEVDDWGERRTF